jgi:hypothetical protein
MRSENLNSEIRTPTTLRYLVAWILGGVVFLILDAIVLSGLTPMLVNMPIPAVQKITLLKGVLPIVSASFSLLSFLLVYRWGISSFRGLNTKKVLPYSLCFGFPIFVFITNSFIVDFDLGTDILFLSVCAVSFFATNILVPFRLLTPKGANDSVAPEDRGRINPTL